MKPLLVRIAALGTVVVLGLFAIAQAQRGSEDKNPLRGEIPLAVTNDTTVATEDYRTNEPSLPPREEPTTERPSADPFTSPPVEMDLPSDTMVGGPSAPGDIPDASEVMGTTAPISAPPSDAPAEYSQADNRYAQPLAGQHRPEPIMLASANESKESPPSDRYGNHRHQPTPAEQSAAHQPDPPATQTNTPAEPQRLAEEASSTNDRAFPIPPRHQEPSLPPADAFASSSHTPPSHSPYGNFDSTPSNPQAVEAEGNGQPGSKQLDGPQSPHLTIEKTSPSQIQVGKNAIFKVTVRNMGSVPADEVVISDLIPKGTRLVNTTPRATRGPRGEVVWQLGTLAPGEQSKVEMVLVPTAEGEIGSVATVQFNAAASARCTSTKPELAVKTSAPSSVLVGEQLMMTIEISNNGSGTASGVVLEERIPAGLEHPAGSTLEYEIGDLPAGESRKLELTLTARRPGPVTNVLAARDDGILTAEDRLELEVVAPKLDVALSGPKRRYLEREATYQLSVSNPGTAPAQEIELSAYLPDGLKFVSANNSGYYDETKRAVFWRLEELPTNESGTVELTTLPVEAGQHSIRLCGKAQRGLKIEKTQPIIVEGIAAILFQTVDVNDPIEVGGETTYEIRVLNQGSKEASNVRLAVMLPPELRPIAAEGPSRNRVDGNRVVFEPLGRLAPKADTTYRVRAQALKPGDLRTSVQLLTDEMGSPVTKEESTRVFGD